MRAGFVAAAVAALASVVSAEMGTLGFALGTKRVNGECKDKADYDADLKVIAQRTDSRIVRSYAANECDSGVLMLQAARDNGFKVVLGVWVGKDGQAGEGGKAVKSVAAEYKDEIYAVTVGSEALLRGDLTGAKLNKAIKEVKAMVPELKVGTADSWNMFYDGTADAILHDGVDIIFINAFSFWQEKPIDKSVHVFFKDIGLAAAHIQDVDPKIEIWVGETGWPSVNGFDYKEAKGGMENARRFYKEAGCGIRRWGVNVFYFEAFDEPWKPKSVGENGDAVDETAWGVMYADRKLKFDLSCPEVETSAKKDDGAKDKNKGKSSDDN